MPRGFLFLSDQSSGWASVSYTRSKPIKIKILIAPRMDRGYINTIVSQKETTCVWNTDICFQVSAVIQLD